MQPAMYGPGPGPGLDKDKYPRVQYGAPSYTPPTGYYRDPESLEDIPLVPGISATENMLRWGFIKKVYGIISIQLLLTAIVAGVIVFNRPVQHFVATNLPFQIVFMILPFLELIALYIYKDQHPVNLAVLGVFTATLAVSVGMACSMYAGLIVLEAVVLTFSVVAGLTAYAFWAARKGKDFSFLGPMLFAGLWVLIVWGLIQVFLPPSPISQTIYALLGAIIFSLYIVYDTHLLIEKFSYDDYIWGSVTIYLDIINLFLYILQLLGRQQQN